MALSQYSSQYSNVTDELLSAYIDGSVTNAERALVEDAAAHDQLIAWRLDSLRQTVSLLGQLSDVPLPRSFMLTASMLTESIPASEARRPVPALRPVQQPSLWERWRQFWQAGNPMLRNAAAVCAVLLVVLLTGDVLTTQTTMPQASMATSSSMSESILRQRAAVTEMAAGTDEVAMVDDVSEDGAMAEADSQMEDAPVAAQMVPAPRSLEAPAADASAAVEEAAPTMAGFVAESEPAEELAEKPADEDGAPMVAAAMLAVESIEEAEEVTEAEPLAGDTQTEILDATQTSDDTAELVADLAIPDNERSTVPESDQANRALVNNITVVADTPSTNTQPADTPMPVALARSLPEAAEPAVVESAAITSDAVASNAAAPAPVEDVASELSDNLEQNPVQASDPSSKQSAARPSSQTMIFTWLQWLTAGLLLLFVVLWLRSRARSAERK